jgi:Cellulase (glycosyl hydrolase family 5)
VLSLRLAALVLAFSATGQPAQAQARAPLALGIQDDAVLLPAYFGYPGRSPRAPRLGANRALDEAAALGISLVKLKAQWSSLEPRRGVVDTSVLAAAVDRVRRRGMTVMVLLTGPAPGWANPTRRTSAVRPDAKAFGRFAAAVATALNGRVESYAVWNEPNWPTSLRPRAEAAQRYRWLYKRAFQAIRAADPGARIVFGNLAPLGDPEPAIPPLRFLRKVLCLDSRDRPRPELRCAPLQTDGIGLHPYTLRWSPTYPGRQDDATTGSLQRFIAHVDRFAAAGALRSATGAPLPVDLIEWGVAARSRFLPARVRGRLVTAGLALVCAQRRVRSLVWYQLVGPPPGPRAWDTGLLTYTGARRAAFTELQTIAPTVCPLRAPGGPT